MTFLTDIFDLANSSNGEQYLPIRDSVIIPRGATITRILIASLTGALPSSRLESVVPSFIVKLLTFYNIYMHMISHIHFHF